MSNREISIRAAEPQDAFGIHETLLRALKVAGTNYPEPDMPYCIQAMLDQIAQGFLGVAISPCGRRIIGVIWLDYGRWPWCSPQNVKAFHLYNQHFWVEPDFRKGGTAKRLLDFAKSVADRKQLALKLEFSNLDMKPELRDRFARINGFGYTGGVFYRAPAL
jgi:GNAT superfamily N-acetyltransferase